MGPPEQLTPTELHVCKLAVTSVWSKAGYATQHRRTSMKKPAGRLQSQTVETVFAILHHGTITRKPGASPLSGHNYGEPGSGGFVSAHEGRADRGGRGSSSTKKKRSIYFKDL